MYSKNKIKYKLSNDDITIPYDIFLRVKTDNMNNVINQNNKDSIKIIEAKNKIDNYYNYGKWDKFKKYTNPYEKIYLTYKKIRIYYDKSYEPLSRSYFKMIEMSKEFLNDIVSKKEPIKTVHLAEGPGGFIEGLIDIRQNISVRKSIYSNDKYYGMTLSPINDKIPGWTRATKFLNKNKNVHIVKGYDNTGNLYNIHNHKHLISRIGDDKADLVTGDGGFDFSIDYNLQEVLAHKLIFSQMILALAVQKINGTFICKLFDTNTQLSKEIIYILINYYDEVSYYKPFTSRPANSEKYIICKKFKGITSDKIIELQNILNIWNSLPETQSIISIIEKHQLNCKIIDNINRANEELQNIQIKYIQDTINLIKKPMNRYDLSSNNDLQTKNSNTWINYYSKKIIDNLV